MNWSFPTPWRVIDKASETKGYISIVDSEGDTVCELFPFSPKGRGKGRTLYIAELIVDTVNKYRDYP